MTSFHPATEVEATHKGHGGISHVPHPNGSLMGTCHPVLSAFFARWVLDQLGVPETEAS